MLYKKWCSYFGLPVLPLMIALTVLIYMKIFRSNECKSNVLLQNVKDRHYQSFHTPFTLIVTLVLSMKRWIVLFACLFGALACYTLGFSEGSYIVIGIGVGLELAFWLKLIKP